MLVMSRLVYDLLRSMVNGLFPSQDAIRTAYPSLRTRVVSSPISEEPRLTMTVLLERSLPPSTSEAVEVNPNSD
jgi:hypothetical protein